MQLSLHSATRCLPAEQVYHYIIAAKNILNIYCDSGASGLCNIDEGLPRKTSFRHPLDTVEKVILALENTLLTVGGFCRKKSHEALKNLQH